MNVLNQRDIEIGGYYGSALCVGLLVVGLIHAFTGQRWGLTIPISLLVVFGPGYLSKALLRRRQRRFDPLEEEIRRAEREVRVAEHNMKYFIEHDLPAKDDPSRAQHLVQCRERLTELVTVKAERAQERSVP